MGSFLSFALFHLVKTKVDREGSLFLYRGKATTLGGLLMPFPLIPAAKLLNKVSHWCIFFTNVSGHHKKYTTEAAARDQLLSALSELFPAAHSLQTEATKGSPKKEFQSSFECQFFGDGCAKTFYS